MSSGCGLQPVDDRARGSAMGLGGRVRRAPPRVRVRGSEAEAAIALGHEVARRGVRVRIGNERKSRAGSETVVEVTDACSTLRDRKMLRCRLRERTRLGLLRYSPMASCTPSYKGILPGNRDSSGTSYCRSTAFQKCRRAHFLRFRLHLRLRQPIPRMRGRQILLQLIPQPHHRLMTRFLRSHHWVQRCRCPRRCRPCPSFRPSPAQSRRSASLLFPAAKSKR